MTVTYMRNFTGKIVTKNEMSMYQNAFIRSDNWDVTGITGNITGIIGIITGT